VRFQYKHTAWTGLTLLQGVKFGRRLPVAEIRPFKLNHAVRMVTVVLL
jgi:hypothetical protein